MLPPCRCSKPVGEIAGAGGRGASQGRGARGEEGQGRRRECRVDEACAGQGFYGPISLKSPVLPLFRASKGFWAAQYVHR